MFQCGKYVIRWVIPLPGMTTLIGKFLCAKLLCCKFFPSCNTFIFIGIRTNPRLKSTSDTHVDTTLVMYLCSICTAHHDDHFCDYHLSFSYLMWNDAFVSTDRISELKPYQRINHYPGMGEICRKDCLARNMSK